MTHPWTPELVVDEARARTLLARHVPQFARARIEPLGQGWDNAAYLVDGAYVFRFPQRAMAGTLIAAEIAVLPRIAPALPLPIPVPLFAGAPDAEYPWHFAGYRLLPGDELARCALEDEHVLALARDVGAFLRALHAIDPSPLRAAGLGGDAIGRLDGARRLQLACERFAHLHAAGHIDRPDDWLEFLERTVPAGARRGRECVVHGDLYARHILVARGRASGIIDWGDVHFGDPALDLAVFYAVLPPFAREAFAGAYGPLDGETLALARYRAIYHSAMVAHHGMTIGDEAIFNAGMTGLRYARPTS